MTISTSSFYDRSASAMAAIAARADRVSTQISSRQKLLAPSDDSVAYQRLQGLARAGADDKAYGGNLAVAASVLAQSDSTLTAITNQLQQATELATRAANGTLTAVDRKTIGDQLAGIVEQLAGLANTVDARGEPLFGGADGGAGAVKQADGSYKLADKPVSTVPVGDGQSVQANETAARIFATGSGDALAVIAQLAAALQAGDATTDAANAAIDGLVGATDTVANIQGSIGARAARVDLMMTDLKTVAVDREASEAAIDGYDDTAAIVELQKTMTILSATQASFGKLSQLSLFDYLR
ncbi:flagellar biosynthesis protein FlgL [Sphingomonas sp.]|uniref:flagellin N-terminal helical domain-containing protein n=1 Tax=Sphingomonas sp. TaxID=28214 RepID=UPI0035BC88A4